MKRILLLIVLAISGCSEAFTTFPTEEKKQAELTGDVNIVRISSKNIGGFHKTRRSYQRTSLPKVTDWSYLIGVGDVISVSVFDHPELNLPSSGANQSQPSGFRVQSNGAIHYPFIGEVQTADRSVQSVRQEISQKLRAYITDPQVDVRVLEFNSQGVVVSGEVELPNRQPLTTVPLTLLQAVNAAGGWTEFAEISKVTLRRNNKAYSVDLRGFLEANISENNPVLIAGDVVHVPLRENEEAFVMGEVLRNGAVDVSSELVSVTAAINEAGGARNVRSDARGVFVFRQAGSKMSVYQFDTTSPEGWLLGTKFTLAPQDVIFVTRSPLQHWNDTITQLLPTVSAISSLETLQANF
ncbi:sugar ABC transporter substrate-binding protein [Shimia litoralis]|uniref:Sugar ABC transporter substrate-binding protein n=1 Tax=Shimia litoralis TaxID=420403 RepID=A0A4U7MXZ7_9RHOB|nr:polysaccharide biosynthesis/export family protein [Shimia litoralis]TKZ18092.1 sugar ABC transporter substrate-binding protein [Shimia litoralis]